MKRSVNIKPEELDHILQQFTFKNLSKDMAMFFITQDINYNDLFKYSSLSNTGFYKDVFTYILAFLVDKAKSGRFNEHIWDITARMSWDYYRTDNQYPYEDYYTTVFFKDMFKYFIENKLDILITYTIDAMFTNHAIDPRCIVDLILCTRELHHKDIILHLLRQGKLYPKDILDLILTEYNRSKNPDTLMILMEEYALTKDYYIDLLDVIKDNYIVITDDNPNNTKSIYVSPRYKSRYNKSLELIRIAVGVTVNQDADLDMLQFLDSAINTYEINHDIKRANIYTYIKNWLLSDTRNNNRLASLLWYGYEDCDLELEEMDYTLIAQDILVHQYIREDQYLSDYELFLRVYNINRFKFIQSQMMYTLRDELIRKLEYNGYSVFMGLRDDIKWLINF